MAFEFSWDDAAHTMLRIDVTAVVAWSDIVDASMLANAMIAASVGDVSVILNFSGAVETPMNVVSQSKRLLWHPRMDYLIVVHIAATTPARTVFNLLRSIRQPEEKYLVADSLAAARTILHERRKSLPSSPNLYQPETNG